MKLGLKNEIYQINKMKEITKEKLEKIEIKMTNIIKELEETEWELICLGAKIIIGRIKDDLGGFEMEMLKTENKMKWLKQIEKILKKNIKKLKK